jgi:hypothetical protein
MHLGGLVFFYWVLGREEDFFGFFVLIKFPSSSQRVPQEVPNDTSILSHIRKIC